MMNNKLIEQVDQFQYLGSIVPSTGGSDEDVTSRIQKVKGAFAQLAPVW